MAPDIRPLIDTVVVASNVHSARKRPSGPVSSVAAMPVRAFVKNYRDEFEYHIKNKCCLVGPGAHQHAPHSSPLERAQEHAHVRPAEVERHPAPILT